MSMQDWRVIVVDDNFDDRQVMLSIFEYHQIPVWVTEHSAAVNEMLDEIRPTLVITDLAMPNGSGWDVLETVRQHAEFGSLPVIAMTSYHTSKLARDVAESDFSGYFPKPVNPQAFVQQLADIING